MQRIHAFAIHPLGALECGQGPRSQVSLGQRPGPSLEGAVLEAQFLLDDGRYLLLLSDDSPYEERIHVVLLDRDLSPLDTLEIGAPYTPGLLSGLEPQGDRLRFRFAGAVFILRVHTRPRRWLAGFLVPGVHRGGAPWWKRYLAIEVMPSG